MRLWEIEDPNQLILILNEIRTDYTDITTDVEESFEKWKAGQIAAHEATHKCVEAMLAITEITKILRQLNVADPQVAILLDASRDAQDRINEIVKAIK